MATKIQIKGIDFSKLSPEQLALIESSLSTTFNKDVKVSAAATKEKFGLLEDKMDANGVYVCPHCGQPQQFSELSDDEQTIAKKYAACKNCIQKIKDAEAIKAISLKRVVIREGESAASMAKTAVLRHAAKINMQIMEFLIDKAWCSKNMSIHYPLFIEKPANIDNEQLRELVTDTKGKRRFAAVEYTFPQIPDKVFLMTNDLYKPKVQKLISALDKLVENAKVDLTK